MLHTNNLRQFAPDHIGQAYLQAFHEHGLQIAYEQGAPIMLLGLTAAATPEQGGTQYNITADMDYGWLDLMYRMYPNMQGVFNTENFWVGGGIPPTCEGSAKMLEIADRFGGFFVWADQDHGSTVTNIISNENMKKALKEHKDAFYLIYKNTSSSQPDDLKTSSFFQGSWLDILAAGECFLIHGHGISNFLNYGKETVEINTVVGKGFAENRRRCLECK